MKEKECRNEKTCGDELGCCSIVGHGRWTAVVIRVQRRDAESTEKLKDAKSGK